MNKRNPYIIITLAGLLIGGMILIYFLVIRDLVKAAYNGTAPPWFNDMVQTFYPRFFVEKHRFDLAFFLGKADQIILRASLAGLIAMSVLFCNRKSGDFHEKLYRFWNTKTSFRNVSILRILYFGLMLLIFKDIYADLLALSKASLFYRPIFLYKLLGIGFPSETAILVIYVVLILSCAAAIFNIYPVISGTIAVADFIYIQGIIFGFEKTDHGFATFTYAGLIMPFLLYERWKANKSELQYQEGWPLQLIRTLIVSGYLFSGLEKLFISKFQWATASTFRSYLLMQPTPSGLWVASSDFLCQILPLLALLFQLGFVLVLFHKKWRYLLLPAGLLFHFGVYLLFNVGGVLNPWILAYIFFLDWDFKKKSVAMI